MALCPAHDDHNPSLSIAVRDSKVLVHCHRGCDKESILKAAGLEWQALFLDQPRNAGRGHQQSLSEEQMLAGSTEHYDYRHANGSLAYSVVRYDLSHGKDFRVFSRDGQGWVPGRNGPPILYRLPELLSSGKETVFIPEGESKADALVELGLVATCNPHGANAWQEEFREYLRGRAVVVLPDNDEPGRSHAVSVAESLASVASSVRIVELPRLPPKGDIVDYLRQGGTIETLLDVVDRTPPVEMASPSERARPTDVGNAKRLVRVHGENLRYCHQLKKWLVYDGRRWQEDQTGEVFRFAKDTVTRIYSEAAATRDAAERKSIAAHAQRSESEPRIRGMISLARSEEGVPVHTTDLDAHPWRLNVLNGTIDLRSGELLPHARDELHTKLAGTHYDSDATCQRWLSFLERVLGGDEDLGLFIQRAVGYALTGSTREQVLFFLYGRGANGKSTLLEVLRLLLGSYARTAAFDTFVVGRSGAVPNDVARLAGVRLVTAQEIEGGRRLAEALVKEITGGDTLAARFLYSEFFEFKPQFKLLLAANHRPIIRGTDHAIWRRIRLIPFEVTIPEDQQDKDLISKLSEELPGILAWAVRGCLEWQKTGLSVPDAVQRATFAYRAEEDVIGSFLNDQCVEGPAFRVSASSLYESYRAWASRAGEHALSQTSFGRHLAESGFGKRKVGGRNWYVGIGLIEGDSREGLDRSPGNPRTREDSANFPRKSSNHPQTIPNDAANASSAQGRLGDSGEGSQ